MRFMMMIKSDAQSEAGVLPDQKLLTEMGHFNEAMVRAGVMLAGEGLQPSARGAKVVYKDGRFTVLDGPYAEAKELVAGYWLIQAKSRAEAVEWATRVPIVEGEIELRQLFELEDFPVDPAEQPDGWRDREQKFRDEAAVQASAPRRKPGTRRFVGFIKADAFTESGALPDQTVLAEMGALMEEMARKEAMLGGEGLKPSATGARVRFSGGKARVIDGPFAESKELIAGYSLMQCYSREEAIEWASRCIEIHVRCVGAKAGAIEVREVFETDDIPVSADERPDGWRKQEERLRAQLGQ